MSVSRRPSGRHFYSVVAKGGKTSLSSWFFWGKYLLTADSFFWSSIALFKDSLSLILGCLFRSAVLRGCCGDCLLIEFKKDWQVRKGRITMINMVLTSITTFFLSLFLFLGGWKRRLTCWKESSCGTGLTGLVMVFVSWIESESTKLKSLRAWVSSIFRILIMPCS